MEASPVLSARRRHAFVRVLTGMFALLVAFAVLPVRPVLARSYSIDKVDIEATVAADGSLAVRETRRFSFDGSFNGVYWKIPVGTYEGREVTLDITAAGVKQGDAFEPLEQVDTEEPGTYQLTEHDGYVQAKLFSPHKNEDADFVISYTYAGLASRWADTAELYWKFVSDGWDEPSCKVTCRVHLPVPSGASFVAGDTVRAWGHGVPSGHVDFEGQDVVYTIPKVGTREFAEARVVFPGEWLAQTEPAPEARLQGILDEEQRWADEANAERDKARGRRVRNCVTMGVVAAMTSLFAAFRKRKHARLHRAYYDGQYFREMPSHDHPVVLASLMEFRERENQEAIGNILAGRTSFGMPACIMRLANEGVLALDKIRSNDGKMQYRLVETGRVGRAHAHDAQDVASKAVDRATLKLLFDVVAARHQRGSVPNEQVGSRYVLISDFEDTASESTTRYTNGWRAWGRAVADAYTQRGFKTEIDPGATALLILGILDFVTAAVMGFVAYVNDVPVLLVLLCMALLVAAGVWCIKAELDTMYLHTPEALELMGKTEALKRWLCDFTRLEEAVPTDVVLWNDLLVMATALGVAKDVIKQLKVKVPQLLEDPAFTSYAWYRDDPDDRDDRRGTSPMGFLTKGISAADELAHPVSDSSSSSYDSSDYSSGSGSGGGFSSGGGGGFGGGGGGGAF